MIPLSLMFFVFLEPIGPITALPFVYVPEQIETPTDEDIEHIWTLEDPRG
jgi:hypothetical protein